MTTSNVFFNREANFIETVTRYAHFNFMVEKQIRISVLFLSNKFYGGFRSS